ncbi:MAG: prepilin peptidase [Candidatus Methanomethyliales bacterium]|nr:prepilin peptidase [Candidatus Methanomethylicales archaeon]
MSIFEGIAAIKIVLLGGALFVASLQDLKSREISDKVWGVAIPLGLMLTILEIIITPGYPYILALLSGAFSVALAFGIYYLGLYGGADAKALAAIAATFPLPPYGIFGASPFFPVTVLGNGIILSLLLIPACLMWNLLFYLRGKSLFSGLAVRWWEKLVAVLIGVKVKATTAESVHFNLIEKVREDGTRCLRFIHKVEDGEEDRERKEEDEKSKEREGITKGEEVKRGGEDLVNVEGRGFGDEERPHAPRGHHYNYNYKHDYDYVWVTPAIPMIVFLLAGFILYFFVGDLVFRIVLTFWYK